MQGTRISSRAMTEPTPRVVGDRVTWVRPDLPDGVGTVYEPTPDEVKRLPSLPEGWLRVVDDHNNVFIFPETQLNPPKKTRKKADQ